MHTSIRDRRTVVLEDLPAAACIAYTGSGRAPIACHSAEIRFDLRTGHLRAVEVRGCLTEEKDIRRRAAGFRTGSSEARQRWAGGTIVRRFSVSWSDFTAVLPAWLDALVEEHRP